MATLVEIEAIPVRIPLTRPMQLASEMIDTADNLIVRVRCSEGCVGWGEAASALTMTGETLSGMVDTVRRRLAPALLGLQIEDRDAWTGAASRIPSAPAACAAVDVALHDLLGRRRGVPVWALLRGDGSASAPLVRTVSAKPGAKEVDDLVGLGTTHVKVKVGLEDPAAEARALCALRERLGPEVHLSADANMAWGVEAASVFLQGAAACRLDYLEQPLPASDISGMAALSGRWETPICIDEAVKGPATISAYHRAGAAHGAGLKLLKLGGFEGALRAEAAARACGWHTTWASKIAETSIGCAATLHAASLSEGLGWGVSLTRDRLAADLVTTPLDDRAASIAIPQGAGLGVELDESQLRRFRIDQ